MASLSAGAEDIIAQAIENVPEVGGDVAGEAAELAKPEDAGYRRGADGKFLKASEITAEIEEPEVAAVEEGTESESTVTPTTEEPDGDAESADRHRQFGQEFENRWNGEAKDRAGTLNSLYVGMTADEQADFLKSLVQGTQAKAELPQGYTPANAFEEVMLPHIDTIKQFPEIVEQHRQVINQDVARIAVLERAIMKLADFHGLKVPDADYAKVIGALEAGKPLDPIMKAYDAAWDKIIGEKKQATKERPPASGTKANETASANGSRDLLTFLRHERANGRA